MFGTVCEIDKERGFVKLDVLGRVTNWLPCVQSTPAIGQQVAFIEYDNDGTGVVLGSLSRTDGSPVSLHIGGIDVSIDGATITVKADTSYTGDIAIKGNVSIDGDLTLTGGVTDSRGDLTNFSTTDGAKRA
ncbi:baseplate assembly protein v [Nitratifractor salsuginis]|uniref:Baseplate assembly protein V, putative n=1 Tax=Nitratifractor salsuginis (strain DSM 16511 / JCM 12458 / E9I37-1) TaxID=749222 RepID=E6X1N6_NITSE|nr:baseplate assembly protein v [Nitratifractor salsuginis]ADV47027.1 baseplate assembly protein V, putative [Nitratifractor salsuginis DSM 16511]